MDEVESFQHCMLLPSTKVYGQSTVLVEVVSDHRWTETAFLWSVFGDGTSFVRSLIILWRRASSSQ